MSARLIDDSSCNHEHEASRATGRPAHRRWQLKKLPGRNARKVRGSVPVQGWPYRSHGQDKEAGFRRRIRFILKECVKKHPSVSIKKEIFGGVPHVRELRLSIGDILSQIYMRGSVKAVVDYYAPHVTEEQIKEALAFAQDVLEITCDPHQTYG
jgi:uncharacterized protein (DUF433 family)